jgi:putative phosphonate metabolism protein
VPARTGARYALYYAPRVGEPLAIFARNWLGWDPETGTPRCTPARRREITAEPRRYGFHGTLKAPFALAEGATERELLAAVGIFAATRTPFDLPRVALGDLDGFLALVPPVRVEKLHDLADACVSAFEEFRRPPDTSELDKRRKAPLSSRQDELLGLYGYPYVFDQFRFHLTLTGRLPDPKQRACVSATLSERLAPLLKQPLPVRDLCLFRQADRAAPFSVRARFVLGGGRLVRTEVSSGP